MTAELKVVKDKMDIFLLTVTCVLNVHFTLAMADFKVCRDCTGRADVPCKIQEMDYPCEHTEYRRTWPGPPRSLRVEQSSLDDQKMMVANFTWKPPYDASISSLEGFFLTVNVAMTEFGVTRLPQCFFANLSGTDWSTVRDSHSVVFHFDCMRTTIKSHVYLTLTSSPMPSENPREIQEAIVLKVPPETQSKPKFKIKYEIHGSKVKVNFSPIHPDKFYIVCLSELTSVYSTCFQKVNTTKSPVIFTGVQRDNYTILIRVSTDKHYFASKYFYVQGDPEAAKPYIDFTILFIIMACVVFVTMATTIAFCIMRKQGRSVPNCFKRCKEKKMYERTPADIPNNVQEQPEEIVVEVVFLESESAAFQDVVNSVVEFLKRWGQCTFKDNCLVACRNQDEYKHIFENCGTQKVIVFLSEKMVSCLTKCLANLGQVDDRDLPQRKIIKDISESVDLNENQKLFVSFEKNSTTCLEQGKLLNLTNYKGKLNDVGLNIGDVQQLLKKVSGPGLDLTSKWSESQELKQVLKNIRVYLVDNADKERFHMSGQDDDLGYGSQGSKEKSTSSFIEHPIRHKVYNESSGSMANQCQSFEKMGRIEDTKQWIKSQTQMPPLFQSRNHNTDMPPQIGFYNPTGGPILPMYSSPRNGTCYADNNIAARLCQKETDMSRYPVDLRADRYDIQWVEPDDDAESVSYSVIGERQQEFNQKYMQNLTSVYNV